MSVSWTPPDPTSRPLDALAFHIQHEHKDQIVQILNNMPPSMTKSIMTKALPKVGKAWEKTDFTSLSRAVSKAAEETLNKLSKENKAEVLKQLHLDKFEPSRTAEIINKIYQVEMLPHSALKQRNMLDNRKP